MSFTRALVFSLVAPLGYTAAYYFNLPLVSYRLADGAFIYWYGWLATAVCAGVAAALIVPRRWAERIPAECAWALPAILVIAVFFYEKRWFF